MIYAIGAVFISNPEHPPKVRECLPLALNDIDIYIRHTVLVLSNT